MTIATSALNCFWERKSDRRRSNESKGANDYNIRSVRAVPTVIVLIADFPVDANEDEAQGALQLIICVFVYPLV